MKKFIATVAAVAAIVPLLSGPAIASGTGIQIEHVYYDSTMTTEVGRWILFCDNTTYFWGELTPYHTVYNGDC